MLRTARLELRRWRDEDRTPFAALNADPEVMRYFPRPLTRAESDLMADRIEALFDEHGYGLWAVDVVEPDAAGAGSGPGFIGFVGLAWQRFPAHFTPALEIGWRLARHAWGHGYATEAARAVRDFAFRPAPPDAVAADDAAVAAAHGPEAHGPEAHGPEAHGPEAHDPEARRTETDVAETRAAETPVPETRSAASYGAGIDEIVSMTTRTNERSQAVMRRIGMTRDPADDFRHPNLEPDHPLVEHVLYRLRRPAGS